MIRFDDVLSTLAALEQTPPTSQNGWTVAQTLAHCAQSVEYSLTGFPKPASFLVRKVFGPMVMRKFLARGAMKHELNAPIPGAADLGHPSLPEAAERLRNAIASFRAHQGELAPHFAYGPVPKDQYEQLHAMHFGDHFTAR